MAAPRELDRRGIGPWEKNRRPGNLGGRREIFSGSALSRVPESVPPGIIPIDQFVKEYVVPFGQRFVDAQGRVVAGINKLLSDFPQLADILLGSRSGFVLAAETAGYAKAEQLMYASTLRQRYDDLKNSVDQRIARLSQRSLAPGVPVVVLDAFYPKDKSTGTRHPNKRNIVYAAGGAVSGLTLAGVILSACEALSGSQGSPTPPNPNIPVGSTPFPGISPTPEANLGVHPLTVVCPNPIQTGDQKYPLSVVTPKLQGIAEYKNVNAQDAALVTQLNTAINKKFGPNDLIICSPAYREGVSPVVNQVTFDKPTGEGNWFVFLEDGRLVGPKEDKLFTSDNKWVQANDVAHYSLGRVGEGKFDSMVFTAPRKNATDPEVIVGILDRQIGRVLTGKEMIDKYGSVFSKVPFAVLASLEQFRAMIPQNVLPSVDHFGYVPTPTPDGRNGLQLVALNIDNKVVWAQNESLIYRMPELKIEGSKFMEGESEIILKGAVAPHFVQDGRRLGGLTAFKRDIKELRDWGANFLIVQWNSGYVDDSFYVENLITALEYAKSLGFTVELSLHSRGLKTVSGGEITNNQIDIADGQIIQDWDKLFSNPNNVRRIRDKVDIFSPLSEPKYVRLGSGEIMRWNQLKPIYLEVANMIREKIIKPNAIVAFSPPNRAGDAREVVNDPILGENNAIEIHPYQWIAKEAGFENVVQTLINKGVLVFVGEIGWEDPPEYVRQQVEFLQANKISFAFWGMIAAGKGELLLRGSRSLTPNGIILKEILK